MTTATTTTAQRQLRVMFVTTNMTVGGQETLLVELIRRLDRNRFAPELCCLKELGSLGEMLSQEIPAFANFLSHKLDVSVWGRLTKLMKTRRIDAVITVGTGGDRMFWGRLGAWRAGVPVIASAIHSTGWPSHVEWPNRRLVGITDAFIAVADAHGRFLVEHEGCPAAKVHVIPNGVDSDRFRPQVADAKLRHELGIPAAAAVVGIVAEIRPEKDHELWLQMAARVHAELPDVHYLIVGDGPQRKHFEHRAAELGLGTLVHFCGRRMDVPALLNQLDVFVLSSVMEANPVSILEAMASGKPVVSTAVGSIAETVLHEETGYLARPGNADELASYTCRLLEDKLLARRFGEAGRELLVENCSVHRMVRGYEQLIESLFHSKQPGRMKLLPATTKV